VWATLIVHHRHPEITVVASSIVAKSTHAKHSSRKRR
jgi:hypothetical protein